MESCRRRPTEPQQGRNAAHAIASAPAPRPPPAPRELPEIGRVTSRGADTINMPAGRLSYAIPRRNSMTASLSRSGRPASPSTNPTVSRASPLPWRPSSSYPSPLAPFPSGSSDSARPSDYALAWSPSSVSANSGANLAIAAIAPSALFSAALSESSTRPPIRASLSGTSARDRHASLPSLVSR